jgi:hypothetical protein
MRQMTVWHSIKFLIFSVGISSSTSAMTKPTRGLCDDWLKMLAGSDKPSQIAIMKRLPSNLRKKVIDMRISQIENLTRNDSMKFLVKELRYLGADESRIASVATKKIQAILEEGRSHGLMAMPDKPLFLAAGELNLQAQQSESNKEITKHDFLEKYNLAFFRDLYRERFSHKMANWSNEYEYKTKVADSFAVAAMIQNKPLLVECFIHLARMGELWTAGRLAVDSGEEDIAYQIVMMELAKCFLPENGRTNLNDLGTAIDTLRKMKKTRDRAFNVLIDIARKQMEGPFESYKTHYALDALLATRDEESPATMNSVTRKLLTEVVDKILAHSERDFEIENSLKALEWLGDKERVQKYADKIKSKSHLEGGKLFQERVLYLQSLSQINEINKMIRPYITLKINFDDDESMVKRVRAIEYRVLKNISDRADFEKLKAMAEEGLKHEKNVQPYVSQGWQRILEKVERVLQGQSLQEKAPDHDDNLLIARITDNPEDFHLREESRARRHIDKILAGQESLGSASSQNRPRLFQAIYSLDAKEVLRLADEFTRQRDFQNAGDGYLYGAILLEHSQMLSKHEHPQLSAPQFPSQGF